VAALPLNTNTIKNHHFLCPDHANFHDSGAKDKLIILISGALVDCEACIYELQHGRKAGGKGNGKGEGKGKGGSVLFVRHNAVCNELSGKADAPLPAPLPIPLLAPLPNNSGNGGAPRHSGGGDGDGDGDGDGGMGSKGKQNMVAKGAKKKGLSKVMEKNSKATTGAKQSKKGSVGVSTATATAAPAASIAKKPMLKRKNISGDKAALKKTKSTKLNGGNRGGNNAGGKTGEDQDRSLMVWNQSQTREGQQQVDTVSRTPLNSILQSRPLNSRDKTQGSIRVTPAGRKAATKKSQHLEQDYSPMVLTDDQSVSKWVPCPNPWGDGTHGDGDFVLFSPEDYTCAFEIYGSNPKRFTMYPFRGDCYQQTHLSARKEGGLSVIQLTRDRLALRSFGFRFCYHDFGGACLVTEVEPMSPADSAVSFNMEI
jgi:hypothetical protein